jgi:type I restriction enzyme S subunit
MPDPDATTAIDTTAIAPAAPDTLRPLPDGWRWVRLGDVCEQYRQIVQPGSELAGALPYLGLEHVESNSGKISRSPAHIANDAGQSATFAFDERCVLYGKLRPYLNKVALPDFRGRCTTELIPLLPRDGTDRAYLAWLLRRRETVGAAMQEKIGSRMPRADMDSLLALRIPLPPLAEQRRIAAILAERMAAVERARAAAEAQLAAAQALPAAELRAVFESDEAQEWAKVSVSQVSDRIDYGYTASAAPAIREPLFLRITDIQGGSVDWESVPGVVISAKDEEANALSDGDIVFARTGGTTGKSYLLVNPPRAVFASYLIRIRPSERIDPKYLYLFFQSDEYWDQVRVSARGGAQPNVNATLLGAIELPLPPLPDQRRIAAHLDARMAEIARLREALEAQRDAVNALPAALLRQAFNGEL